MNPFPPRGGGPDLVDHHSKAPAWKRIHRSPFFWTAALCIMIAITVFVVTNGFALWPNGKPVPAVSP